MAEHNRTDSRQASRQADARAASQRLKKLSDDAGSQVSAIDLAKEYASSGQFNPLATGSFAPSLEDSQEAGASRPREITLKAADATGMNTAKAVRDAMHGVIDPELGLDVIDLGLVYAVEIDRKGRAILIMTLTTPACPLTDLIEDETASILAGIVDLFRIDWVWSPAWNLSMITPEGRQQLNAIGYDF
jgi:metal-sulfur cluster biosynthetic enzyme